MLPFDFIGISHALFGMIYFLTRKDHQRNDRIIAVFLLFLALPLGTQILGREIMTGEGGIPWFLGIRSYPFTFGPFLYLFTRKMIEDHRSLRVGDLLHFIPFLLFGVLSFVMTHSGIAFEFHRGVHPPPLQGGPHALPWLKLFGMATVLSLLCYSVAIMLLLNRHRRNLPEYFSSMPREITLNWLRWITLAFLASVIYVVTAGFIAPGMIRHPLLSPQMSHPLSITFFILFFLFFNLRQPEIYRAEDADDGDRVGDAGGKRYEKSGLKKEDEEQYLQALEEYMRKEKPYHEGELTIVDLSAQLGIPRHYITQIINERLKKNFYFYVNEYRVNEVKEKLSDCRYDEHTLLRIALDAGFNSKSSFNMIFKKITGLTPSEYRKTVSGHL